jgi:hypothetical protein
MRNSGLLFRHIRRTVPTLHHRTSTCLVRWRMTFVENTSPMMMMSLWLLNADSKFYERKIQVLFQRWLDVRDIQVVLLACLPFVGSNPTKDDGFLRVIKIRSTPSSGGKVKPSAPCRKTLRHAKEAFGMKEIIRMAKLISFASSPALLLDDSAGRISREL